MNKGDLDLRNNVRNPSYFPILYELLPPPIKKTGGTPAAFMQVIDRVLGDAHIDAINIPEIHEESGQTSVKGARSLPKGDPRHFARELINYRKDTAVIINHVVVHQPKNKFQQWIKETDEQYGIRNCIFVGGESNEIKYPGPGVIEAAAWVRDNYNQSKDIENQIIIGGITIPTRNQANSGVDESVRLLSKAQAGIEFFTSQVIYETESMKNLLSSYDALCREKKVTPKRIFISFAPVSTAKDIKFLRWLGVAVPLAVERKINEGWIGLGWRSVEICQNILSDILAHIRRHHLQVPIGINVEHVMKYNVELSRELLVNLTKIIRKEKK